MDIRKFAVDVFSDQFGKAERCYLCGFDWLDPKVSICGLLDCPMKNAAPQGQVNAGERRSAGIPHIERDALARATGNSQQARCNPADAAPLTAEQIAFNEVGMDDDPWYRKAAYEHLRGERRR